MCSDSDSRYFDCAIKYRVKSCTEYSLIKNTGELGTEGRTAENSSRLRNSLTVLALIGTVDAILMR